MNTKPGELICQISDTTYEIGNIHLKKINMVRSNFGLAYIMKGYGIMWAYKKALFELQC